MFSCVNCAAISGSVNSHRKMKMFLPCMGRKMLDHTNTVLSSVFPSLTLNLSVFYSYNRKLIVHIADDWAGRHQSIEENSV